MVRLPLIGMCSRETDRLPAAKVNKLLNTNSLPLEVAGGNIEPSKKFIIYFEYPEELQNYGEFYTNQFRLVEIIAEFQEKIILTGIASAMSFNFGSEYVTFHGDSEKIGNYAFYCPFFERARN